MYNDFLGCDLRHVLRHFLIQTLFSISSSFSKNIGFTKRLLAAEP